jgi:hypothetical protein
MAAVSNHHATKVPAVTLGFWIIKILATTLGETGGNTFSMTMDLGYLVSTAIFLSAFYWAAITFSQTLGTALGDWLADTGLGYEGGALVFTCGLAALAAAYFWTDISRVLLFWAAFILTRPLGPWWPSLEPSARLCRCCGPDDRLHTPPAAKSRQSPAARLAVRVASSSAPCLRAKLALFSTRLRPATVVSCKARAVCAKVPGSWDSLPEPCPSSPRPVSTSKRR